METTTAPLLFHFFFFKISEWGFFLFLYWVGIVRRRR